MAESKRDRYQRQLTAMQSERSSYDSEWLDIAQFLKPKRYRPTRTDTARGGKRNQKIIDSTGTQAANVLRAGMQSGMTNPARPWYRFGTADSDLAKFGPVKNWLEQVRTIHSSAMLKSNFYNAAPMVYGDMGVFGSAACAMMEDDEDAFRFTPFPLGEWYAANDNKGRARVFMREFRMTVRALVMEFGQKVNGTYDWSNFSPTVKTAWDRGNYGEWIDVVHVVEPNDDYDPRRLHAKYKPFSDCYFENGRSADGNGNDVFLREKGFDEFPIMVPRWEVGAGDVYGSDCPGMTALGDVKQLQTAEKISLNAIDLMVRPPMIAPSNAKSARFSQFPGDINYYDESGTTPQIRPFVDTSRFRVDLLEQKNERKRQMIDQAFYVDLFRLISSMDAKDVTATAIAEMKEEKLLMLGPVFGQSDQDWLKPVIDRGFNVLWRNGMFPPPPPELQGQTLDVEYISIMAEAQKAQGRTGLDVFTGFATQLAAVKPEILDRIDGDILIEDYAERTSIRPDIIRSDEQVQQIRASQAQAAAAQQSTAALSSSAEAAKNLSAASLEGNSALTALVGGNG
jgi:hypothetical protein